MQIGGMTDRQVFDKFIRGLKPKTRIEVELLDPKTTAKAFQLVDRFDRIVYGTHLPSFLMAKYNQYTSSEHGEPMQIDTLCPHRPKTKTPAPHIDDTQRLCFNCQKPGHIAMNCPRKSQRKPTHSGNGQRQ